MTLVEKFIQLSEEERARLEQERLDQELAIKLQRELQEEIGAPESYEYDLEADAELARQLQEEEEMLAEEDRLQQMYADEELAR